MDRTNLTVHSEVDISEDYEKYGSMCELKYYLVGEVNKLLDSYEQAIDELKNELKVEKDKNRHLQIIQMFMGDTLKLTGRIKELEDEIAFLKSKQTDGASNG